MVQDYQDYLDYPENLNHLLALVSQEFQVNRKVPQVQCLPWGPVDLVNPEVLKVLMVQPDQVVQSLHLYQLLLGLLLDPLVLVGQMDLMVQVSQHHQPVQCLQWLLVDLQDQEILLVQAAPTHQQVLVDQYHHVFQQDQMVH